MHQKRLMWIAIITTCIVVTLVQKDYHELLGDDVDSSLRCVVGLALFQGKLWAAAYGQGLYFYDRRKWHKKSGVHPFITCLTTDGSRLWYGTWMHGTIGYVGQNLNHELFQLPTVIIPRSVYRVQCIAADQKFVLVGTSGYLLRYSEEAGDWDIMVAIGNVNALAIDSKGEKAWIGTGEGCFELTAPANLNQIIYTRILSDVEITAISKDKDVLWIGGLKEGQTVIWKYILTKRKMEQISTPFQAPIAAISPIKTKVFFAEGSSSFYINSPQTYKSNIFVYDTSKQLWQSLQINLKVKDIKCLLWLKDELWIGGVGGVQKIRFPIAE